MLKEGLIHSSAEMVCRQPLVVPGEFFPYDSTADQSHAENLRRIVRGLALCRPSKQHQHTTSKFYKQVHYKFSVELKLSDDVFIREDAHKPPLSNPYRGPHRVPAKKQQIDNTYVAGIDFLILFIMAFSRQYLLFVRLYCYDLQIPDLHCTTYFLNYLLIINCTDTNNHSTPSQDLSDLPPPYAPL